MGAEPADPAPTSAPEGAERDQLAQNIAAVQAFYLDEERKMSQPQRAAEFIDGCIGRPAFPALTLAFVALWVSASLALGASGIATFDPPPFAWLQGLIGLAALLTGTIVLSKQSRLAGVAERRARLDLKVMLLTEQKAAKVIDLLEELRRDLPNVRNRHDSGAWALQQAMGPDGVLAALSEQAGNTEPPSANEEAADTGESEV
jgi:uncharacterized membrane protein